MFLFGEDVQLIDRTADYAPLVVIGPKASAVLGELLGLEPEFLEAMKERYWMAAELPQLGSEPLYITRVTVAGRSGWRLEAHPDHAPSLWQALVGEGATPGGLAIFDILRAEACVPLFGVDVDDSIYPQEARYEAAFSLDKGCYIGQEVVAKIDTYGGLNKRLYALATGEEPVRAGTRLMRAWSFALDSGLSLGYVKRRHQDVGTEFRMVSGDEDPATAPIAQLIETPLAPAENPE
jgi:folate-binding protein YgfZ